MSSILIPFLFFSPGRIFVSKRAGIQLLTEHNVVVCHACDILGFLGSRATYKRNPLVFCSFMVNDEETVGVVSGVT